MGRSAGRDDCQQPSLPLSWPKWGAVPRTDALGLSPGVVVTALALLRQASLRELIANHACQVVNGNGLGPRFEAQRGSPHEQEVPPNLRGSAGNWDLGQFCGGSSWEFGKLLLILTVSAASRSAACATC